MKTIEEMVEVRDKTHGPFNLQAMCAQELKEIIRGYDHNMNRQQLEAMDMILHKIARIAAGNPNVDDHWDDIAGYAMLANKKFPDELEEQLNNDY